MIQVRSRGLAGAGLLVLLLGTVGVAAAPSASARSGADMAAGLSGPRTVRLGEDITYTITGTNVGDGTATGVQLSGLVEDWFDPVAVDCGDGTASSYNTCDYGDVAPGQTVSMTLTMRACCPEKHMLQYAYASATNDVNAENDWATMRLNFRGPRH